MPQIQFESVSLLLHHAPATQGAPARESWNEGLAAVAPPMSMLVALLGVIFSYILIRRWMDNRERARADVVRLLEEAVRSPTVDRATVELLASRLAHSAQGAQRRATQPRETSKITVFVFGSGWITLLAGLAIWAIARDPDWELAGICATVLGFALLTFPFALRELEARRART